MNFRPHAFQPFCCFQFLNSPACLGSRFSPVRLFVAPWTVARQAPRPWGFPGENMEWVVMPVFWPRGQTTSLCLLLAGGCFTASATWEAPQIALQSTHLFTLWFPSESLGKTILKSMNLVFFSFRTPGSSY